MIVSAISGFPSVNTRLDEVANGANPQALEAKVGFLCTLLVCVTLYEVQNSLYFPIAKSGMELCQFKSHKACNDHQLVWSLVTLHMVRTFAGTGSMLLFQYLVNVLEGDFVTHNTVYEGKITSLVLMLSSVWKI